MMANKKIQEPISPVVIKNKDDPIPVHLYFGINELMPINLPEFKEYQKSSCRKIILCDDWNELIISFKLQPESICINAAHLEKTSLLESLLMIDTFMRLLNPGKKVSVTLGINDNTPYEFVSAAKRSGIMGIVPSNISFGWSETVKGLEAQWNDVEYWPKHIINSLPGAPKKKPVKVKKQINLTRREQQVFDIITNKACSNKHVARLLGISESTVKLHLGNIFRKYNVRSRIQLAVFSAKAEK